MQKRSELVASRAVLNAPQKVTPATNPPRTRAPSEKYTLGREIASHIGRARPSLNRHDELAPSISCSYFGPWKRTNGLPYRVETLRTDMLRSF